MVMEELFEKVISDILDKGYCVIDNFLNPTQVKGLKTSLFRKFEQGDFKKAGIGKNNPSIINEVRGDHIFWLEEDSANEYEKQYLGLIREFSSYVNRTCFLGLKDFECHYAVYPEGSFYKRHLDRFRNDDLRKFSVICYLNEDWGNDDGGELKLYLPDGDQTILPVAGRFVCFESHKIEHEVLPGKKERLSITGWIKG